MLALFRFEYSWEVNSSYLSGVIHRAQRITRSSIAPATSLLKCILNGGLTIELSCLGQKTGNCGDFADLFFAIQCKKLLPWSGIDGFTIT